METKNIFKLVIDTMDKEFPLRIGKYDNSIAVGLKRNAIMVLIPEKDFIFDIDKLTSREGAITDRLLADIFTINKDFTQVFPTATTIEHFNGALRVFEGSNVKTYVDTRLLKILWDAKRDKNITFYTRGSKSPVVLKDGDNIIGCICPVRYAEGE